jgi:ribonucleotide reductase beta subunit family protein with ferritin-like domain
LRKFEEIDKLSDKEKNTVKEILDTFILKDKFQKLAQAGRA